MSNYVDHSEEGNNVVKIKSKPSKVILIATYLGIWTFSLLTFWFFISGSDAMGYSIVFLWIVLPVATFVISLLIGTNNYPGKLNRITPALFGIMQMLAEYATFGLANMLANSFSKINMPRLEMFLAGAIISAVGLGVGTMISRIRFNCK